MSKEIRPDIKGEMDEFERMSQDLMRNENISVSVAELIDAFENTNEQILSDDVWVELENTESNEIEKGDIDAVNHIAKMYHKTNPDKLIKAIKSGVYNRPLIVKIGDRYILMAGNTRLCTAAAMGVNPKVFIGDITSNMKKQNDIEEQGADSAGAFEAPFGASGGDFTVLKRDLHKFKSMPNAKSYDVTEKEKLDEQMTADVSAGASYDVPLFAKTPKGGRKNPLAIEGPSSIAKSRAVTDPKFPKWGGPGGIFIKIKEKCKKFPYCNQGDINAIEPLKEAISKAAEKYGIPRHDVEKIVINEINKIFINYEGE